MRWEGDQRGRGVTDAGRLKVAFESFLKSTRESGWVAEEPEHHLLPPILDALKSGGNGLTMKSWRIDGGALELTLSRGKEMNHRGVRAAVFDIVGRVGESATFIRETVEAGGRRFEVCTGTLDGDGQFSGHGHLLCLLVGPD